MGDCRCYCLNGILERSFSGLWSHAVDHGGVIVSLNDTGVPHLLLTFVNWKLIVKTLRVAVVLAVASVHEDLSHGQLLANRASWVVNFMLILPLFSRGFPLPAADVAYVFAVPCVFVHGHSWMATRRHRNPRTSCSVRGGGVCFAMLCFVVDQQRLSSGCAFFCEALPWLFVLG